MGSTSTTHPNEPDAPRKTLPEKLRAALEAMTPSDIDAVDALRAFYDQELVFQDPIQKVRGVDAFIGATKRMLTRSRELSFKVASVRGDDEEIFLEWTLRCVPKIGPTIQVDGVTRARAKDGRIYDHRDYWDLGELFASGIPFGQQVLRTVLKPLA